MMSILKQIWPSIRARARTGCTIQNWQAEVFCRPLSTSPAASADAASLPLAGIKVLDMTRVLAGVSQFTFNHGVDLTAPSLIARRFWVTLGERLKRTVRRVVLVPRARMVWTHSISEQRSSRLSIPFEEVSEARGPEVLLC